VEGQRDLRVRPDAEVIVDHVEGRLVHASPVRVLDGRSLQLQQRGSFQREPDGARVSDLPGTGWRSSIHFFRYKKK